MGKPLLTILFQNIEWDGEQTEDKSQLKDHIEWDFSQPNYIPQQTFYAHPPNSSSPSFMMSILEQATFSFRTAMVAELLEKYIPRWRDWECFWINVLGGVF